MSKFEDFQIGDRVKHIGRGEEGQVQQIDRDVIHVRFDNPAPSGNPSGGIYDATWFRLHPDLLINLSRNDTMTERRRAGGRIQQTPGA